MKTLLIFIALIFSIAANCQDRFAFEEADSVFTSICIDTSKVDIDAQAIKEAFNQKVVLNQYYSAVAGLIYLPLQSEFIKPKDNEEL